MVLTRAAALLGCIATWLFISGAAVAQIRPLLIGAEDDWAPFSSVDSGKPVGMSVEIVTAIFAQANIPIKLIPMPFGRCMKETLTGRLAACFNTVADAKLRSQYLFHTRPLFTDDVLILVRKDAPVSGLHLRDLLHTKVLITSGYTYGGAFEAETKIERQEVIGDLNVLRGLKAGQADYGLMFRRVMAHQLRNKGKDMASEFKVAGLLSKSPAYLSFSKRLPDSANVIKKFDAAHLILLQNNAISDIERRWE